MSLEVTQARRDESDRRKGLFKVAPHLKPIRDFIQELRITSGHEILDADPCDGGVNASVLFLSLNATKDEAEYGIASLELLHPSILNAMREVGLSREDVFNWSVVPWAIHNRFALKAGHPLVNEGLNQYAVLTRLLPQLSAVVLFGKDVALLKPQLAAEYDIPYIATWSTDKRTKYTEDREQDLVAALARAKELSDNRPKIDLAKSRVVPSRKELLQHAYA